MTYQEHDGQVQARFDGDIMELWNINESGTSQMLVGKIDTKTCQVLFEEDGYEEMVRSRLAPMLNVQQSLGFTGMSGRGLSR